MQTANRELIELETRFWHALVEEDADTATALLDEPAMIVSSHGAMRFNHAEYRQMVEKAPMLVRSFELSDMKVVQPTEDTAILTYHVKQDIGFRDGSKDMTQEMTDSSVWTRKNGHWLCVMHTETPVEKH